jgi:hypothetical protein
LFILQIQQSLVDLESEIVPGGLLVSVLASKKGSLSADQLLNLCRVRHSENWKKRIVKSSSVPLLFQKDALNMLSDHTCSARRLLGRYLEDGTETS